MLCETIKSSPLLAVVVPALSFLHVVFPAEIGVKQSKGITDS